MTDARDRSDLHEPGHSSFAQRGQSHEERMPEDDSARRFPQGAQPDAEADREAEQDEAKQDEASHGKASHGKASQAKAGQAEGSQAEDGRLEGRYGSGGSYGYGGGFEHQGEAGYEAPAQASQGRGGEEFYESAGSFGHEPTYEREAGGAREAGTREAGERTPLKDDKGRSRRG